MPNTKREARLVQEAYSNSCLNPHTLLSYSFGGAVAFVVVVVVVGGGSADGEGCVVVAVVISADAKQAVMSLSVSACSSGC